MRRAIWETAPAMGRQYHPFDRHLVFREMATDDRLLDCVQSLIGPDISLQHSKLNMKPAHVGSAVEWHQDMTYFPHTNDDLITLLIYLDDATKENGCLRVLPRQHFHYFSHDRPDGTFAGMITEPLANGEYGRPVELAAPAGSVILMHCITPHSSLSNRTSKDRRTLIFEYRANDSFPIYCGKSTVLAEAEQRLIRGKPARCARFGGPPPPMPNMAKLHSSLYALQEATRAEMGKPVLAAS